MAALVSLLWDLLLKGVCACLRCAEIIGPELTLLTGRALVTGKSIFASLHCTTICCCRGPEAFATQDGASCYACKIFRQNAHAQTNGSGQEIANTTVVECWIKVTIPEVEHATNQQLLQGVS